MGVIAKAQGGKRGNYAAAKALILQNRTRLKASYKESLRRIAPVFKKSNELMAVQHAYPNVAAAR